MQQRLNEIFEAYATLSIEEERNKEQIQAIKEHTSENYASIGQLKDQQLREKIEEQRKDRLKEFNINALYRYNGGHPNKFNEFRGNALGRPGDFHSLKREWEKTEEDCLTDFKVTDRDVDLYTEVKRAQKDYHDVNRSYFRPEVLENFSMTERFSTLYYCLLFVASVYTLRELNYWMHNYVRKNSETYLKLKIFEKNEDGVVYVRNQDDINADPEARGDLWSQWTSYFRS